MEFLTRRDAQQSQNITRILVDVSELGPCDAEGKPLKEMSVYVRAVTAQEKDLYESSFVKFSKGKQKIDMSDARARAAVIACVDAENNPIFQPEDVSWLTHKSAKALTRIYNAFKELSEISKDDEEELVKNSEPTPTFDS